MGADEQARNKATVRRLVDEVFNAGRLDAVDDLYAPAMVAEARAWIAPFLASFPGTRMEVVALVAEGDAVMARFRCSGAHLGPWRGHPATGRRFEDVDEAACFRFEHGRIAEAWGVEDNLGRMEQLGLLPERTDTEAGAPEAPGVVVACSLGARELAERSRMLAHDLFAQAEAVAELPHGYAWRFPGDGDWHARLLAFAESERRCCSFFRITLEFGPNLGPVWLRLTGPEGAKAFVREAFGPNGAAAS